MDCKIVIFILHLCLIKITLRRALKFVTKSDNITEHQREIDFFAHQPRGFTLVELLIVIVVIAILAAITIVAYNGITTRADASKAQANAESAQKVAETYNVDAGSYPITAAAFATGYTGGTLGPSAKSPSGLTVVPDTGTSPATTWVGTGAAGSSTDGVTRVTYACTAAAITGPCDGHGGRIGWWKFGAGAAVNFVYVGTANASSTFFYPAT
jgi:prepilin-type N-terminal cleavage/methylation domain-containing protein